MPRSVSNCASGALDIQKIKTCQQSGVREQEQGGRAMLICTDCKLWADLEDMKLGLGLGIIIKTTKHIISSN